MKDPKKFIRIMCLILVAVMVLGLIPAIVFAAGEQTILLSNTAGWSTPYIYYWSDSNTVMTSWPGVPMTRLEGDLYYHAIPSDATYVIFNDGNGTQTADLTIPQGMNHFNYGTGSWSVYEGGDFCVHSYDGGTVTTAPTCISTGVRTYTCTKCGDIRTEDVAQTSHSYVNGICTVCGAAKPSEKTVFYENVDGWSIVNLYYWSESDTGLVSWPGVPMTVYEGNIWVGTVPAEAQFVIFNNGDGQQTGDLTLPGNGYLYSYSMWFPYLLCEHSYGPGVITKAPTCEEEGETTFACTLCGETTTEPIPATGHSYENDVCTVCGAVVECAEHTWDEGSVTQEATCWLDGAMTYTCTVCKRTKDERIPGGHKLYISEVIEPTCTKTGKEYTKCYGCAYSMDRTLPKIDHSYTIPGATVAPTCTEDGYTVYACTGCGAEQNGDLVYHTGHKWSGNTCTACGTTCAHNYVDGVCRNCDAGGPAYVKGWYEISNAAQLRWFASQVNSGNNGINGRLIADIDLAGSYWTAIGYYCSDTLTPNTMPYTGTFDGQGHTVSNFVSNGTDNEGLFGYCESATIRNVGVTGAKITGWRVGAVVGYALTSTVTDCFAKDCTITGKTSNSVALSSGAVYIAPITCPQSGTVSNCYAVDCKLVDSTDLMVETCPVGGLIRSNNYYSNVTFSEAFTYTSNTTEVTDAQLASGEVTYLLNKGITDGTQRWYQTCGTGLPAHSGKTVYQTTGADGSVTYTNGNDEPDIPVEPTKPEAPVISSCYSKEQTTVKVTWTAVDGADGYQIYRSTSPDGSTGWQSIKTVKDGKQTTYTNQSLTVGVTYYYKVRAYIQNGSERIYSDFSEVKFMPAAVVWDGPYSNATFRIRLRWDAVGSAHGYQIWRQNADGTWSVVKTLGDRGNTLTNDQGDVTAYSNTGLTAGGKYTYKMRAFYIDGKGGKIYGAYSDEITVSVMPETPVVTVTSPKAERAQVKWTVDSAADGYQVWMSESEGSGFSIIKSIADGDTLSYTKSGLESGKTYYFKVRAYSEVDGKKTFGAYSETIAITVK